MKAQSSLEFLLTLGLAILLVFPAIQLFMIFTNNSAKDIVQSQIDDIGDGIIDAVETVKHFGDGAKVVLELNMPNTIENIEVFDRNSLYITMRLEQTPVTVHFDTFVNMTGDFQERDWVRGRHDLEVENRGGEVFLSMIG